MRHATGVRAFVLCSLATSVLAGLAEPAMARPAHVKVLLDTSASMKRSDQDRLAILAIQLLGDLVEPGRDSIEVLPFDPSWRPPCGTPPETLLQSATPASLVFSRTSGADPAVFHLQAQALPYRGDCTYFAPGLKTLLDRYPATAQPVGDESRLLLVVTDGVSDAPVRDRAAVEALVKEAVAKGVRVWWVLLGPGGGSQDMATAFSNVGAGDFVAVAAADQLLPALTSILTREAGWTEPATFDLRSAWQRLDLPANLPLAQLVVLGPGTVSDQHVDLQQPGPGGTPRKWTPVGGPDEVAQAAVPPVGGTQPRVGYVRLRLRNPPVGSWRIRLARGGGPYRGFLILHPQIDAALAFQDSVLGRSARVPVGGSVCFEAEVFSVGPGGRVPLQGAGLSYVPELIFEDENLRTPGAVIPMGNLGTSGDKVANDHVWSACATPTPAMALHRYRSRVSVNYFQPLNTGGVAAINREGPEVEVLPRLRVILSPARIVESAALDEGHERCADIEIDRGSSEIPRAPVRFQVRVWEGTDPNAVAANKPLGDAPLPLALENARISWNGAGLTLPGGAGVDQTLTEADVGRRFKFCVAPGTRHVGGRVGLVLALTPVDPDYRRSWSNDAVLTWEGTIVRPPFPWKDALVLGAFLVLIVGAFLATRVVRVFPAGLEVRVYGALPTPESQPQLRVTVDCPPSVPDRARGYVRADLREGDGIVSRSRRDGAFLGTLRSGGGDLYQFRPTAPVDATENTGPVRHPAQRYFSPTLGTAYRLRLDGRDRYLVFGYAGDAHDA